MCTVSVNVDKALLQNMKPELDSMVAIQMWAQRLIDYTIQKMELEEEETMSVEEARALVHETIRKEYALP